jgi:hypothetical protein
MNGWKQMAVRCSKHVVKRGSIGRFRSPRGIPAAWPQLRNRNRMINIKRLFAAAGSAAVLALMLGVSAAHAGCNPANNPYTDNRSDDYTKDANGNTISSYINGWNRPIYGANTQFDWAKADIDSQSQYNMQTPRCSTGKGCDFTYDWIMLRNLDTASKPYWAQIGPATMHDGSRANFVQCNTAANGISNAYLPASTAGTQPTYEVLDLGGTNGMELEVLGQHYDFCGNATFTVGHAQAAGEMLTRGDQFPGDQPNHDNFDNMKVHFGGTTYDWLDHGEQRSGATPHSAPWMVLTFNFTSNTHMETWDYDCP